MQIDTLGNPTLALRQHVEDRVRAALDQHENRVDQVVVKLRDVNGPKGGADQRCQLTIRLRPRGLVIVRELGEDMYAVISLAADRAKRAVKKALEKRQPTRRRGVAGA